MRREEVDRSWQRFLDENSSSIRKKQKEYLFHEFVLKFFYEKRRSRLKLAKILRRKLRFNKRHENEKRIEKIS